MPGLSDTEIEAIQILRNNGVSQRKAAEMIDVSRSTVRSHEHPEDSYHDEEMEITDEKMLEWFPEGFDWSEAFKNDHIPDAVDAESGARWAGAGPASSPYSDDDDRKHRLASDYSNMSPGEFIESFFDDFEVGVKTRFVKIVSRRADRRGALPKKERMENDLKEMSSGLGNTGDIEYVVDEYWAEAQEYLQQTDVGTSWAGQPQGGQAGGPQSDDGDWVTPGGGGATEQPQQGGQWVQLPNGQMQYGTWTQGPNGEQVFQPMQPPAQGQGPPMGQGRQPMGGQSSELADALETIAEQQQRIEQRLQRVEDGGREEGDTLSEIERMVEMQSRLEELAGQDDSGDLEELATVFQSEIGRLRSEINDTSSASPSVDGPEGILARVATRENVDPDQIAALADAIGHDADPEVAQKRIEKEMKEMELQNSAERMESLVEGLERVADTATESLVGAMLDDSGGDGSGGGGGGGGGGSQSPPPSGGQTANQPAGQQQPPAGQNGHQPQGQPTAPAPGQADISDMAAAGGNRPLEEWECPECGSEEEVDPSSNANECSDCGFSIAPCPDCAHPVEIPPEGEPSHVECPDCLSAVGVGGGLDGEVECPACATEFEAAEANNEKAVCGNCGADQIVYRSTVTSGQ